MIGTNCTSHRVRIHLACVRADASRLNPWEAKQMREWEEGLTDCRAQPRRVRPKRKGPPMRSITTRHAPLTRIASTRKGMSCALAASVCLVMLSPASATIIAPAGSLRQQLKQDSAITEVVVRRGGGAAHRTTVVGPRGGVATSRTVVRGGAVVRPGVAGAGVRWARPGRYYWPRGGAIAAGAAIGFVTAATAAAWAGAAPAPGMCWYYTDPSRTQGFWGYCQ